MYASMPVRGRIILIIAAAACVYVVGNGRIALWDRDEPRYALASQWMARSGDWVVPRIGWGAQPTQWRTAKPILTYWCQATAMKCLGVSAFAARLPSSVAVTLTLIVMALAVWRRLGPEQAMWTVLILASSALVIAAAKMCITDALLLLWITIAQLALLSIYHRAQCGDGPGWGVPIVMWIAAGLAGLTKGPVVLGVMCATLMVLAVLDVGANVGRWRSWGAAIAWWRRLRPIVGLVVLGAVTGPWLYLIHQRAPGFLHDAIWHDVIGRAGAPLEGHKGPPGFYLASIWGTYLPWSLLLPLAMVLGYRHRKQPVIRFALAGVIGPWLMMELVQTKLVHYVLPVFPFLAILTADALVHCFGGAYADLRSRATRIGAGIWAIAIIAIALAPWLAMRTFDKLPIGAMVVLGALGIVYAAGVFILFVMRRSAAACAIMGIGMLVWIAALCGLYLPHAQFLRLSPRAASVLVEQGATQPGEAAMIGYTEQSLAFYQGGTIESRPRNWLKRTPPDGWPRWIVITRQVWQSLTDRQQSNLTILGGPMRGLNYAGGGDIVELLVVERTSAPP